MALTFVIGSGIIFAMPYADAAGAIEGEFKLGEVLDESVGWFIVCLLYTSPSPRDRLLSRMPSSA